MRTRSEGRLLRLGLDRAEKRNALNARLCGDLVAALEAADADGKVGAVLLEAEGPVFCAGMDLEEAVAGNAVELTRIHEKLFTAGAWMNKPLVAGIEGAALGGGVGLAASAHVAVAAETAVFALPEIKIGMWPFVIWRAIVEALGERRALELSLTGRRFGAREAEAWGLVHMVEGAGKAGARAEEIARQLAESSAEAIGRGLELARRSRGLPAREAGQLALELRAKALAGADFHEGVAAFRQKRPPCWPSLEE